MALEVIGAGFGRTGTTSLTDAVEMLGFTPCYAGVNRRPSDAAVWRAALRGETTDWGALFGACRSAIDWPVCTFWEELSDHYPDARVILTVREPNEWYESVTRTLEPLLRHGLASGAPDTRERLLMADEVILQHTFRGRFHDQAYALQVFREHIDNVRNRLPAERLLVFESEDGWEPLCDFLEVPVPALPYPHTNSRYEFWQELWRRST